MVALWLLIAFLGGSVVARKPYLKQTLSSTPNGADKYQVYLCRGVTLYLKQTDDECFYLWDTIRLNPVSHKLKYLWNVNNHQLTVIAQHPVVVWRP